MRRTRYEIFKAKKQASRERLQGFCPAAPNNKRLTDFSYAIGRGIGRIADGEGASGRNEMLKLSKPLNNNNGCTMKAVMIVNQKIRPVSVQIGCGEEGVGR